MIKHIVMFRIKAPSEDEKRERVALLKNKLEKLPPIIPEIKYFEAGINVSTSLNSFDLVLVSEFENAVKLEVYRKHPEHQMIVKFIKEIKAETVVVDYEK
jgi:hypothetical protein